MRKDKNEVGHDQGDMQTERVKERHREKQEEFGRFRWGREAETHDSVNAMLRMPIWLLPT